VSAEGYRVRFVASASAIDAALWDACFAPGVEGRWWYESLEQAGLQDQFTFLYGLILRDGAAVGIAPAFLMRLPTDRIAPPGLRPALRWLGRVAPSLVYPRTLFVGSPCADEGTVGLREGADRQAALAALQDALAARARAANAPLMVWKDLADPAAAELAPIARRERLFRLVSFPGTVVALPAAGKEAYYAALKGSRRHVLRKKLRLSRAAVALRVEVLRRPDANDLDALFGLFWQTYERATTRFETLNRRFFDAIAAQPPARFIVLREQASGAMVAFMLCFELGPRVINKFIGLDYRRPRQWRLYFRLWEAALDWALARGATSIQSGQTGYAPKIETGHALVPLVNYCAHRNPLIHALAGALAGRVGWSTLDEALARHLAAHPQSERR
jgi:hypothetical protein